MKTVFSFLTDSKFATDLKCRNLRYLYCVSNVAKIKKLILIGGGDCMASQRFTKYDPH